MKSPEDNINFVKAEHCRASLDLDFYTVQIGRIAIEKANIFLYRNLPNQKELDYCDLTHNPFTYLGSKKLDNITLLEVDKRLGNLFENLISDSSLSMQLAEEVISFNEYIVEIIRHEGESFSITETDNANKLDISGVVLYLQTLGETVKDLHNLVSVQKTETNSPNYARLVNKFPIISIMDGYLKENPDAIFDLRAPCSYGYIKDFVNYYESILKSLDLEDIVLEATKTQRQSLIQSLAEKDIADCFGCDADIGRIKQIFQDTPIALLDPLSALILNKGSINSLSWFNPNTRLIYINYLDLIWNTGSIDFEKTGYSDGKYDLTREILNGLLYASSNNAYILKKWSYVEDGTEYDTYVESRDVWPDYLVESITDLVSRQLMSQIFPEVTIETKQANCYNGNLVDAIISAGDWSKADISNSDAKSLLLSAFFDRDNQSDTQAYSKRKDFMSKLHQATYLGYLQDIYELIDMFGLQYVDSLLNSKNLSNVHAIGRAKRLRPKHLD